jgi:hypothetical protein
VAVVSLIARSFQVQEAGCYNRHSLTNGHTQIFIFRLLAHGFLPLSSGADVRRFRFAG